MNLQVLACNHQKVHFPQGRRKELKKLKLMEYENRLIRCEGSLENSELPYSARYPFIIRSKTDFAR